MGGVAGTNDWKGFDTRADPTRPGRLEDPASFWVCRVASGRSVGRRDEQFHVAYFASEKHHAISHCELFLSLRFNDGVRSLKFGRELLNLTLQSIVFVPKG